MTKTVTLAHSPDADDAFMFWAIAKDRIDTRGFRFEHELVDIETLNRWAEEGKYDVTAISFASWPRVRKNYRLMRCGASVGDGYGPLVVAREPLDPSETGRREVAIPGERTTAALSLRLFQPEVKTRVVPFDEIPEEVLSGRADLGLLIHEGQLTYRDQGLHPVVDLGAWWKEDTGGLPLPLGGNAIRRDIPSQEASRIASVMGASFRHALENREEALAYALSFGRGVPTDQADRFVGMYVNDFTIDLGERGVGAVQTLLEKGVAAGAIEGPADPEFVG